MPAHHYEPHIMPNPSKPYYFHWHNRYALPHWHENIEILYMCCDHTVRNEREEYPVKAGDVVVFGSNTIHAVPSTADRFYDCLIVSGRFLADNDIHPSHLRFECVVRDEQAAELFRAVANEVRQEEHPFKAAAVKAAILALVVYLCRHHSAPDDGSGAHGDAVKSAIGYITDHLSEPMSIDEIAEYAKVSKYYFCREFHRETGFTVIRYINNLRCREAERLLRGSEHTVGEISRMCGFENLSYFTRTFRSVVGCTPSEIRM